MPTQDAMLAMPMLAEDRLAAESRQRREEYEAARSAAEAAWALARATADPTTRAAYDRVSALEGVAHDACTRMFVAELARHLPGLAPAIHLLWAHIVEARLQRVGTCCTDGGPIDP